MKWEPLALMVLLIGLGAWLVYARAPHERRDSPPRDELLEALIANDWNKSEVARQYGKHPRQITRWMQYLGIERPSGE